MIFGALALILQAVYREIWHFLAFAISFYGCLISMPMTLDYHKRKLGWTQKSCSQVRQSWICRSGGSSLTGCLTIGKTNLRTLRYTPKIQLFCVWMRVQGPETSVSEHHSHGENTRHQQELGFPSPFPWNLTGGGPKSRNKINTNTQQITGAISGDLWPWECTPWWPWPAWFFSRSFGFFWARFLTYSLWFYFGKVF